MFQKIVCPIDFSEFTDEIIEYSLSIAKKYEAEIHLLHVIPTSSYFTPYESFLTTENIATMEKSIESEIERDFEEVIKKIGIPVKKAIRTGDIFVEILKYIKNEKIDLVVMGTHGRSGFEHIIMGSVAEKVIRKSPSPVLTIRPKANAL